MPATHPKSATNAVRTVSSPTPRRAGAATGALGASRSGTGRRAATRSATEGRGVRVSVGDADTSETPLDLDDRRPEDHDEDRREDAEHQREQHLDRRLLRLLLRAQPATDAHLVGLRAQQA